MRITFGPVPSRRLGRSLGIDLVPLKTCTYSCIYCQLGPTLRTTVRRRSYLGMAKVLHAIQEALERAPGVDYLTFSGSGEPTLHKDLGAILRAIKQTFALPVAVLTNGALLYRADMRRELREADVVLPSLDAWTDEMFQRINRPHPTLRLRAVLDGMEAFRKVMRGEIWLEVLFVRGVNDAKEDLPGLVHWVRRIKPDRVQINTVVRPPAEPWVHRVEWGKLEEIRSTLGTGAEIVAPFRGKVERSLRQGLDERILEMVLRRPVAPEDLVDTLGIGLGEARAVLDEMAAHYGWVKETYEAKTYFRIPTYGKDR